MASLAACGSIFQLAFGLNAVAAASELYFRNTHRDIAARLLADLRPEGFVGGVEAEQTFEKFVLRASPGLRIGRKTYRLLMVCGVTATLLSFIGLTCSATIPETKVPDRAVWLFSVISILVLPTAYWLYSRYLRWFERSHLVESLRTPEERELYWRAFEIVLPMEAQLREMKQANILAQDTLARLRWRTLVSRFQTWWDGFTSWRR